MVDIEDEGAGQQMSTDLRGLLGGPRVPALGRDPKELKDWLASINKGQLIHGLSDRETVYMVHDAATGKVSEFISDLLTRDPQLTWGRLEELLIQEYANEWMAIEAMRGPMKLAQLKDETTRELGVRAEKLATLAFPEEVKTNAMMRAYITAS